MTVDPAPASPVIAKFAKLLQGNGPLPMPAFLAAQAELPPGGAQSAVVRSEFLADAAISRAAAIIIAGFARADEKRNTAWMEEAARIIFREIENAGLQVVAKDLEVLTAPDWIPVAESLPDGPTTVLVACTPDVIDLAHPSDRIDLGYHDGDVWRAQDNLRFDPQPTHWMDLPSPPAA